MSAEVSTEPVRWKRSSVVLTLFGIAMLALFLGPMLMYYWGRIDNALQNAQIVKLLADQETAWNAGDLDGFMAGYLKSDGLEFLSGGDVTTGWQATYDRYQKRYKGEGKEMGKLKFDILGVDVLSGNAAVARGKWALTLSDGSTPHGLFTLLFRLIDGEWKIVSDHTSAAEK
jgi:beta-aspartyl-peptidase (threonine type)